MENVQYGDESSDPPYRANMKVCASSLHLTKPERSMCCSDLCFAYLQKFPPTSGEFMSMQVVTVEPGGHTRDHSRKIRLLLVRPPDLAVHVDIPVHALHKRGPLLQCRGLYRPCLVSSPDADCWQPCRTMGSMDGSSSRWRLP